MIIRPIAPISIPSTSLNARAPSGSSFEAVLGKAVQGLSDLQKTADAQAIDLATGKTVNLVDSILAMEQTSLSFKLAMQVRDKVIEAYQDIMRTQL